MALDGSLAQKPSSTSLGRLLKYNLLAFSAIFLLLEIWRPCYFLTDDNLDSGLPTLTEVGRHLKSGQSPFFSDYIFGGHYNLLRDAMFFCWHPIYLLASLLADTRGQFLILDVIAFFFLALTTAGFVTLAFSLRQELRLPVSDLRLTFYTLSFVTSMYVLTVGACWANFLGNLSALPWLALGILQVSWRKGTGLIAFFSLHQFLGGHLVMSISNSLFLSLFAVGIAGYRRSSVPLLSWGLGNILGALLASPLLIPVFQGFLMSQRFHTAAVTNTMGGISPPLILFSFLFGNIPPMIHLFLRPDYHPGFPHATTLLPCAAAYCLIPALLSRARWSFLEKLCLGMAVLLLLFIVRPHRMNAVLAHIPLLKSMRYPFREIMEFQFFLHLFLVLRPQGGTPRFQNRIAFFSLWIFLLPLPFSRPPSFLELPRDRAFLFSGGTDKFWSHVKSLLHPDDEIAAVIPWHFYLTDWWDFPISLLGAGNYPELIRVKAIAGYSVTVPQDQYRFKTEPYIWWYGAFIPDQIPDLYREHPRVKLLVLENLHPLKITLRSQDAPDIDLTPYIPDDETGPSTSSPAP